MGTIPVQSFHSSHIRSTNFSHLQNESSSSSLSRCLRLHRPCQRNLRLQYCHWNRCPFTGTGGTHVLLASGTAGAVAPVAAVAGAAILLKAAALLHLSESSRKKRSDEENDAIFTTIAAAEPASCVKQLICDIATGTKPSENDVILSLFENDTPVSSPKFDFAIAATLGKQLKSVEACELRYTCPVKL